MNAYEPTIWLDDLNDDENDLLNHLLEELQDRADSNALRASYYDQKHFLDAVHRTHGVIPPQYFNLGIVLGWTGKAVDALARRCHLIDYVWPDGDLDSLGASAVWDENMLGAEIDAAFVSSLVHGPAFLVNTLGEEDEGEPRSLIHVKDALSATGTWNPRRRHLDNLVSITARHDQEITGLAFYLDGETVLAEKDGSGWTSTRDKHPWGVPAEVLPYKPSPRHPFGLSRITPAIMSIQDRATKAIIRLEVHSDIYAIPDLWMFGADESIFTNADGSMRDIWRVVMGRLKAIPDDDEAENPRAEVKQFPAASPQPHLAGLNAYAKMFAREASLPDSAVAITDLVNPTSADAYDAAQQELIAEAEGATADWSPALRRCMVRALAIYNDMGMDEVPADWASIDTKWNDPRFLSKSARADAGLKQLQAVPWLAETQVGLELLGLTPQQIKTALADRRRAEGRQMLEALQAAASRAGGSSGGPGGSPAA